VHGWAGPNATLTLTGTCPVNYLRFCYEVGTSFQMIDVIGLGTGPQASASVITN